MTNESELAEAARLLSQAASNLMNQTLRTSGGNVNSQAETTVSMTNQPNRNTRETRARDEFRQLFASYNSQNASTSRSVSSRRTASSSRANPTKKRKTVKNISIHFFCLANTTQQLVPNNEEKQQLLVAGLGEKKITLSGEAAASDVMVELKVSFPKLSESGGYEFMYAKPSSRELCVIEEGESGHTMDFLKRFVGRDEFIFAQYRETLT